MLNGIKIGTIVDFTPMDYTKADIELLLLGQTVEQVVTDHQEMTVSIKHVQGNWGELDKLFEDDMKQIRAYVEGLPGVAKERLAKIFIAPNFDKVFRRAKRRRLRSLCRRRKRET